MNNTSNLMLHEQESVLTLLRRMTDFGLEFSILGGYPRDMFFQRDPNDLDVCVFNFDESDECKFMLNQLVRYLQDNNIFTAEYMTEADDNPYDDERIYCVLKTTLNVDIIVWGGIYQTKEHVLAEFDYNLNQFELVLDNYDNGMYAMPVPHCVKFGELHMLRDYDIDLNRQSKMKGLAHNLGWTVGDFI